MVFAIGSYPGQPGAARGRDRPSFDNLTWSADSSQIYREQLIALTRPQCANEVDDDGDSDVDWPADAGCASELGDSELPDQDGDGVDESEHDCLTDDRHRISVTPTRTDSGTSATRITTAAAADRAPTQGTCLPGGGSAPAIRCTTRTWTRTATAASGGNDYGLLGTISVRRVRRVSAAPARRRVPEPPPQTIHSTPGPPPPRPPPPTTRIERPPPNPLLLKVSRRT